MLMVSAIIASYIAVPSSRRGPRSEEHTSDLQSQSNLVCRLLLEKKKKTPLSPPRPYHRNSRHSSQRSQRISLCFRLPHLGARDREHVPHAPIAGFRASIRSPSA